MKYNLAHWRAVVSGYQPTIQSMVFCSSANYDVDLSSSSLVSAIRAGLETGVVVKICNVEASRSLQCSLVWICNEFLPCAQPDTSFLPRPAFTLPVLSLVGPFKFLRL